MTTTTTSVSALVLANVSVQFGGVKALDDVSLDVVPGSIHAVIGPNGAGKSTLFNVISNLVPLTGGEVRVCGRRTDGMKPHQSARLGVARTFQNLGLFPDLTVEQNLLQGMYQRGSAGWLSTGLGLRSARRERDAHRAEIREVARTIGLEGLLDVEAATLSYGDRKRVELARAVCMRPQLLLLDEPVAGMNPAEKMAMGSTIAQVNRDFGVTVVLVEHDLRMVMSLADSLTVLDFGRVIAAGSPDEIREHPDVIAAYLGAPAGRDPNPQLTQGD